MTKSNIPLALPDLTGNEEQYVVKAIRSSWISSTGPFVARFEAEFAAACGTRAAITVCNGTIALHLALLALDVKPGDEIIVPSLTYVATANAAKYVGGIPVFADVDRQTWCLDPKKVQTAITERTKGIIAVHLYGHAADMDEINAIAELHGLWVVEDAAEAPFATYKGRRTGSLAKIGTFSFYGNKIITCGEGGAITVSDPDLEARMRMIRGQGMDPRRRYYFPITGYNFRLTNVACAMLCAQLERYEQLVERRLQICALYRNLLRDVPGIGMQKPAGWAKTSPWLFCITIDTPEFGRSRDQVMTMLAEQAIETRPFFIPLHSLPPFRDRARADGSDLLVTEELGQTGLNLPTYTTMSDSDVRRVCEALMDTRRRITGYNTRRA
jgi:perosamine synthetase